MNALKRETPRMIERPVRVGESREGGFRIALALFTCLFAAWFLFAADLAGAATPYKGKTKGGSAVTFKLKGRKAMNIRAVVPTICVETTGGYSSRAGGELFRPKKPGRIGRTVKSKALQPAAMNQAIEATKNYTVTLKRKGRKVTGTLKLNFSFLIPDLFTGAKIFVCSGSTRITAAPR